MRANRRWGLARAAENLHNAGGAAKGYIGMASAMCVSIETARAYLGDLLDAGLVEVTEWGEKGLDSDRATVVVETRIFGNGPTDLPISTPVACTSVGKEEQTAEGTVPEVARLVLDRVASKPLKRRHETYAERKARKATKTEPDRLVDVTFADKYPAAMTVLTRYLAGDPTMFDASEDRWSDHGRFGPVLLAATRWAWGHGPFTVAEAAQALDVQPGSLRRLLTDLDPDEAKKEGQVWYLLIAPYVHHEAMEVLYEILDDLAYQSPEWMLLLQACKAFGHDYDEGEITKARKEQATRKRAARREAIEEEAIEATDTSTTYEVQPEPEEHYVSDERMAEIQRRVRGW